MELNLSYTLQDESWHEMRRSGIGASDMPIIIGDSPYGNIYDLWLEKLNRLPESRKFRGNAFTDRGQRLEPEARKIYEAKNTGYKFQAENGVHPIHKFARASFDGINHDLKRVLEIKCPGEKAHNLARLGMVPDHYKAQVQWQLFVSGYNDLDYVSWDGVSDGIEVVPVFADLAYQDELLKKATEFWECVKNDIPPNGIRVSDDPGLIKLLEERSVLRAGIDTLTDSYDVVMAKLRNLVPEGEMRSGNYKISWSEVEGQVDYKSIPFDKYLDLDEYRKPPTKRFLISTIK